MFFHFEPMNPRSSVSATLIRFVRDDHYKLYETGQLYDLWVDLDEEHPIQESQDSEEQAEARARLRPIFDEMK